MESLLPVHFSETWLHPNMALRRVALLIRTNTMMIAVPLPRAVVELAIAISELKGDLFP